MKKLLHERLRYIANENEEDLYSNYIIGTLCKEFDICENKSSYVVDLRNCLKAIADEIEKYYTSLPRDTEGNPVHEDMEVEGGVVSHWSVSEDGSWTVFDSNYEEIQCGDKDEPIRLAKPKVLDADGVEIKVGDTVWMKGVSKGVPNEPLIVSGFKDDRVLMSFHNETSLGYLPDGLTHREPDSLEKLLGRMEDYAQKNEGYVDGSKVGGFANELRAIMERDA